MGRPVLLADDLFNTALYPGHVVSAEEEPAGGEAFRAATYRRTEYATATTAHSDWWIRSVFDQPRAFDYLALWTHNLKGKAIKLQSTLDAADFSATLETPVDLTLPAATTSPMPLDNPLGVLTEDGSFLIRFPVRVAKAVRLFVPDMGVGLAPQVTVRAGLSWSLAEPDYFAKPWDEEADQLLIEESTSDVGYRGRSPGTRVRQGTISYKAGSFFRYDLARYHLRGVFGEGFPVWLVHDSDQADRAVLARRPPGELGFPYRLDWGYRSAQIPWVEHDPVVL